MQKVNLTYVQREEKTATSGKHYTSLRIKCAEYGDRFLSGFGNASNKSWKQGDTVEIEVKEVAKDGKTYLNFETPKEASVDVKTLEVKIGFLAQSMKEANEKLDRILVKIGAATKLEEAYATPAGNPFAEDDGAPPISDEDVPW